MATPTNLPSSFSVGQVLTAANMNDLRGAFRILQVVHASHATQVQTTSTTYVTTNLSASITPSSTSSKVLAFATVPVEKVTDSVFSGAFIALFRGTVAGTNLVESQLYVEKPVAGQLTLMWLDSPNTTSSQTYTVGLKTNSNLVTVRTCFGNSTASMVLCEVSA